MSEACKDLHRLELVLECLNIMELSTANGDIFEKKLKLLKVRLNHQLMQSFVHISPEDGSIHTETVLSTQIKENKFYRDAILKISLELDSFSIF